MKPKSVNLLDIMTPEHREKASRREPIVQVKITSEYMAMAELGFHFGWEAVRDLMNDAITLDQAHMFILGARKLHSSVVYDQAVAGLAANSTKLSLFNKLMGAYIKDMKDVQ